MKQCASSVLLGLCVSLFTLGKAEDLNDTLLDLSTTPSPTVPQIDLTEFASNYALFDYLGVVSIPFPLDICVQVGIDASKLPFTIEDLPESDFTYATFSCSSDGSTVSAIGYSDETCTTEVVELILEADNNTFVCENTNDYASLDVYANGCSGGLSFSLGTLYAAVGVCFELTVEDETYYQAITCGDQVIQLSSFADENCTYTTDTQTITECQEFVAVPVNGVEITVYYQPGICSSDLTPVPTEDEGEETGQSSSAVTAVLHIVRIVAGIMVFVVAVIVV